MVRRVQCGSGGVVATSGRLSIPWPDRRAGRRGRMAGPAHTGSTHAGGHRLPGAGKSAVLGRVVTTADARTRVTLPPEDENVKGHGRSGGVRRAREGQDRARCGHGDRAGGLRPAPPPPRRSAPGATPTTRRTRRGPVQHRDRRAGRGGRARPGAADHHRHRVADPATLAFPPGIAATLNAHVAQLPSSPGRPRAPSGPSWKATSVGCRRFARCSSAIGPSSPPAASTARCSYGIPKPEGDCRPSMAAPGRSSVCALPVGDRTFLASLGDNSVRL